MAPLPLLTALLASLAAAQSFDFEKAKKDSSSVPSVTGSPVKLNEGGASASCSFPAEVKDWEALGWKNLTSGAYLSDAAYPSGAPASAAKTLDVNLVILNNADWTDDRVREEVRGLAKLYQQCSIKIGRVHWVWGDSPTGKVDMDGVYGKDPFDLAAKLPCSTKPVVFFIKSFGSGHKGFSYPARIVTSPNNNIRNTSWLPSADDSAKKHPGYVNAAHELGHVLNLDHELRDSPTPNLMHGNPDKLNGALNGTQCKTMRDSIGTL